MIQTIPGERCTILGISVTKVLDPSLVRPNDNTAIVGWFNKIHEELWWDSLIPFEQSHWEILEYWKNK